MNEALEKGEFIIDSHRGAFKNGKLENTIPAFEEAIMEGANVLECDVRGTRDGEIVLVHNRTIDHVAGLAKKVPDPDEFGELPSGAVGKHTISYLQALEFDNGARLMTLREFLDFIVERKVGAQVELKEFHFIDDIIEVLSQLDVPFEEMKAPVVFTSFNFFAILKLRKAMIKAGLPIKDNLRGREGFALGYQGIPLGSFFGGWVLSHCKRNNIWGFMTHYRNLPASRIPLAHEKGVKFCPRVPDDEDLVISYINANVDGFETDNVPFIIKCIEKTGYTWPR